MRTLGPFRALTVEFHVETDDDVVGRAVAQRLADLRAKGTAPPSVASLRLAIRRADGGYAVAVDGDHRSTVVTPGEAVDQVLMYVNQRIVLGGVADRVLFHAAALSVDGRVVLLPGASHAGKTTTAAVLAAHGFAYLTDEAAAVHPDTLSVLPYPKPLGMRGPVPEPLPGLFTAAGGRADAVAGGPTPVAWLGGAPGSEGRLVAVVVVDRHAQAAEPDRLSRAECLVALAESALDLPQGRMVFSRLVTIAEQVPAIRVHTTDLGAVPALLRRALGW